MLSQPACALCLVMPVLTAAAACLPACQSLNLSNNDMHGEFAREFAKSIRTVYEKGVITRVCNLLR